MLISFKLFNKLSVGIAYSDDSSELVILSLGLIKSKQLTNQYNQSC